ncbi:MAG: DUF2071 domain-containing protein [Thermoactinomyces sp.]
MTLLNQTSHRPYPLPDRLWLMTQTWEQILLAHWEVPIEWIREKVPAALEVDLFDGKAWISIVPYMMGHLRLRGLPPIPFTSRFPGLNVRTYVVHQGKPGVYFLSLDAANRLVAALARTFLYLPYYYAQISIVQKEGEINYSSRRVRRHGSNAGFQVRCRPISPVFNAQKGTLDYWLTERYCFYTTNKNSVYRCDIHHLPWPLMRAEADFIQNSMMDCTDSDPILHYAEKLNVFLWPYVKPD